MFFFQRLQDINLTQGNYFEKNSSKTLRNNYGDYRFTLHLPVKIEELIFKQYSDRLTNKNDNL